MKWIKFGNGNDVKIHYFLLNNFYNQVHKGAYQ